MKRYQDLKQKRDRREHPAIVIAGHALAAVWLAYLLVRVPVDCVRELRRGR